MQLFHLSVFKHFARVVAPLQSIALRAASSLGRFLGLGRASVAFLYFSSLCFRGGLLKSLALLLVALWAVCKIFAAFSLIEFESTLAVYFLGFARNIIALTSIIHCISFIKDLQNRREMLLVLSTNLSRFNVLASMVLALFTAIAAVFSLVPVFVFFAIDGLQASALAMWWFSGIVEILILILASCLFAFAIEGFVPAFFVGFAFYSTSRIMGFFISFIANLPSASRSHGLLDSVLPFVSVILPRLDLFCQTSWVIYGDFNFMNFAIVLLQGAIYCSLLFVMLLMDFCKRGF